MYAEIQIIRKGSQTLYVGYVSSKTKKTNSRQYADNDHHIFDLNRDYR